MRHRDWNKIRVMPLRKTLKQELEPYSRRMLAGEVMTTPDGSEKHLNWGPDTVVAVAGNVVLHVRDLAEGGDCMTLGTREKPLPDDIMDDIEQRMMRREAQRMMAQHPDISRTVAESVSMYSVLYGRRE